MEDFDLAIAVAAALAVEEKTDVPKRKRAKWSKEWFVQRSTFGHTKLLRELSHNEPNDLKNFLRMDAESYNELLQMVEPLIFQPTQRKLHLSFVCCCNHHFLLSTGLVNFYKLRCTPTGMSCLLLCQTC